MDELQPSFPAVAWKPLRGLIVLVLAGLVFFNHLGATPLWDRDEPRNAQAALEMQERGDWIVPSFNQQLRHQKPILPYWLIRSAYLIWGPNEFAARFWSAALALLTVGLLAWCVGRALGDGAGLLAGSILASSQMFVLAARATTPDSVLIFFYSAAVLWFAERVITQPAEVSASGWFSQRWESAVFYVLLGCGALSKGLAGVILPMAVVGMWMLLERLPTGNQSQLTSRWRRWFGWMRAFGPWHFVRTVWAMQPVWAVFWIAVIAAPWFIAVGWQTDGEFLRRFFIDEHRGRATTVFESHRGGLWYYPATLLVGFFPWSVFAVPVVLELWARNTSSKHSHWLEPKIDRWLRLACCWVLVQVGIFSIAQTKLPSYVTPCYPALALLTSWAIQRFARRVSSISDRWYQTGFYAWLAAAVTAAGGLAWVGQTYVDGAWYLMWISMPLVLSGLWLCFGSKQGWPKRYLDLGAMVAGAVAFSVALHGWGAARVAATNEMDRILAPIRAAGAQAGVASFRCMESSWVYYGRHPIHELEWQAGPVVDIDPTHRTWKERLWCDPQAFVERFAEAWIIVPEAQLVELESRLTKAGVKGVGERVAEARYFLKSERLVLLRFRR